MNKKIEKILPYALLFILVMSLFFVVKIINELKEYQFVGSDVYPASVISVSGKGEIFAIPDTATFTFSVNEEADTASAAQEQVAKRMNSVLKTLEKSGIKDKDVKTVGYNLYPRYEHRKSKDIEVYAPFGERVLVGYEVIHNVSIKVRESDKAGEIIGKIGHMDISNISSINFVSEDTDSLLEEARKLAIDDARKKAKILSKDLGVRLGRLIEFSDSTNQPYISFARDEAFSKGLEAVSSIPELPVGENKITSQVFLTYEIK